MARTIQIHPKGVLADRRTEAVSNDNLLTRWRSRAPHLLSVLRIVAAMLFMQVGTAKLFAFPAAIMPDGGTAPFGSLPGIAGILETFGGLFLLVGLFTRAVAFLLSGEMAVAYFIGHAPHGFWPVLNQGTDAAFYSFLFLYLSAAGAGPWSLDALRHPGSARSNHKAERRLLDTSDHISARSPMWEED